MSSSEALFPGTSSEFESATFSLGVNMDDLVRITFLEQSARYFGVYINKDQYESINDDKYCLN